MARASGRAPLLGNLEEDLFNGDFEGWTKGLCFPPLGDSMVRASGRAPLLGNLEEDLFNGDFEGWTKGLCFPPLGDSMA